MDSTLDLARVSDSGYVLAFPPGFRWFGAAFTAFGLALWTSLYLEWRAVDGWRDLEVDQWLVVRLFSLPFGIGLLIWSSQRIAVVQNLIVSHHLGLKRRLDRASARVHRTIKSGVYLKDAAGQKLFVSQWLVPFERLLAEIDDRSAGESAPVDRRSPGSGR